MGNYKVSRRQFIAAAGMSAAAFSFDGSHLAALAKKMGPKEEYPAVVIGAGLGGLTCAAYLARQGIPVTVIEQHDVPGGYATAFDRLGGKYTFDVSLHGTAITSASTARILEELDLKDKLELERLPDIYRIKSPAGELVVPQSDPEEFINELSRRFPQEATGIRSFVNTIMAIQQETEVYGARSSTVKNFLKPIFPLLYRQMWKVRNQTLADLLAEHVESTEVRNALSFLWGYYGLPPAELSGFYYAVATAEYLKNGSYYIKERSQRFSQLLAETIESAGGEILFNTRAEKIELQNSAVARVVLSDDRRLAARAVVANCSAPTLFNEMLPKSSVSQKYMDKIASYQPSISAFIIWLGLNRSLRGEVPGYSTALTGNRPPEEEYELAVKGDIENVSYIVTLYDNLYDGYSSPGRSTMMIMTLCGYDPWQRFEADYRAGRKQAYIREKERWAEVLIGRAQKDLIPGLVDMIEVKESATPLTNWRYTGNIRGAVYGFEQSMENAFMNRIENKTPIKGLYLCGAWGNPGGGYSGVMRSGRWVFERLMSDWGA